jgi:hypothetical protein
VRQYSSSTRAVDIGVAPVALLFKYTQRVTSGNSDR